MNKQPSHQAVIEMKGVRKAFGKKQVLQGVDLSVPPGHAFAFLGRNGAGKTTTIRMLLGLIPPDSAARIRCGWSGISPPQL
jgi:ABC-type multidrug transport system ATPase subunit